MSRRSLILFFLVLVVSSLLTGVAGAHTGEVLSVDCTEVHGTFTDFAPSDHPISFEVSVNGGAYQTVPAVEQPPGFVDGTASADIADLTAALKGTPGTVAVFAQWSAGSTGTVTVTLTCGTSPPTTTTLLPSTTPGPTVDATPPVQRVSVLPPPPAAAVPVSPVTTG